MKVRLKGKSIKWEELDRESKKEPKNDQISSSVMNHSQSLFKMEAKVDIESYQGEIDTLKLNHLLKQSIQIALIQVLESQGRH